MRNNAEINKNRATNCTSDKMFIVQALQQKKRSVQNVVGEGSRCWKLLSLKISFKYKTLETVPRVTKISFKSKSAVLVEAKRSVITGQAHNFKQTKTWQL